MLTGTRFYAEHLLNNTDLPGHIGVRYAEPTAFNAEGVSRFLAGSFIKMVFRLPLYSDI